jgi:hypothetical protein
LGAIQRYGYAVEVSTILPEDLLQLQRELRSGPLPSDIERQAASNHGFASIADPVRIPHGIDAFDCLSSEVKKERLAGILYGPDPLAHWPRLIAWYLYSSHMDYHSYLILDITKLSQGCTLSFAHATSLRMLARTRSR